jgi:hypothetical protein
MSNYFRCFCILLFTSVYLIGGVQETYSQNVIAVSDPSITTDTLTSGELVIGVNSNGGGVINFLEIPGVGNIFGPQSVLYGRSGQSAMRDGMHSGRYNPTQAGFNETLGTPCIVLNEDTKITVPGRPLALWYGDCQWDFTEWENIGPDPSCYPDGGNSDVDELDESDLEGKQNTEVKSEFDYFGIYHDYKNKGGIDISCVRHYFEYRYVRTPGHCINQFRPGLDIFNPDQIHPDISSAFPVGSHTAEPFDMSNFILSWHLRNDVVNWDPKFQFIKNNDGSWKIQSREVHVKETLDNGDVVVPRLLIISDSNNPNTENALGFYMPNSEFNTYETIGVDETTGLIEYKDRRYQSIRIWDQPRRIPSMAVYGFKTETKGLLNRTRLPDNVYEAYRFDMFMLMGTPNEIWETINKIEAAPTVWNFENTLENWTFSGGSVAFSDSSVSLSITNEESTFLSPDSLLIDADLQKIVSFRLKNNTPDSTAKIIFKKYDGSTFSYQEVNLLPNNNTWQTYSVNISSNENWTDMIQQIGIEFSNLSGNVEIDLIAVSADGLSDCNGGFGGLAYVDGCGNCVEGNTGIESCEDCMGVVNGEAFLNHCGDCVGGTSPLSETHEWHFNVLNDWTLNPRLSGYANSGIANLSISGVDPYMSYNGNVCLDTQVSKYLKLQLKNNTNGNVATVYYKNDITDVWNFVSIPITQNDSQTKTYQIDLSDEVNWKGNVYSIRFDPPGEAGYLGLDYIGILTDEMLVGIHDVLAASKNTNSEVSVFPNPSRGLFYVKSAQKTRIKVFDCRGIEVFQNNELKEKHTINSEMWRTGVYIIKLENESGVKYARSLVVN